MFMLKGEHKRLYWDKFLVENKKKRSNFHVVLKLG